MFIKLETDCVSASSVVFTFMRHPTKWEEVWAFPETRLFLNLEKQPSATTVSAAWTSCRTHTSHTRSTLVSFHEVRGAGKWSIQLQSLPLLTLMSPVSLSLYWTPVTQPSSSSKLVTEPSTIVTLGGAITQFRDSTVTCQWRIDDRKRTN